MFNQKSVLARLLANENITVQQGNYETAYFNVITRELGLPLWKQMSKDVFDMLVGHEVSHALFTPTDFFEYKGAEDIPHSWLNIVEDIRIEKLILRKYPGLVGNFKRGYTELMLGDLNLFGIKNTDLSTMYFMDRLNIRAKARDLIKVPFAADEIPYFNKAMSVETYDDVVRVCREIQEWLKEKAQNTTDQKDESQDSDGDGQKNSIKIGVITDNSPDADENTPSGETPDIIIDMRENKDAANKDAASENKDDASENKDAASENKDDASENKDDASENKDDVSKDEPSNSDTVEPKSGSDSQEISTDKNFSENSKELVDTNKIYVKGMSRSAARASVLPYSVLAQARRRAAAKTNSWSTKRVFPDVEYNAFLAETKGIVNLMVKEFEMRKAAYRSLRSRESTKGSLDVNKLHKYQYDDMLFKQVSHMADAKNHGMIMLIDYSGSMYHAMPAVMLQTLTLTMFCKRVGIPFDVYGFSSMNNSAEWLQIKEQKKKFIASTTQVNAANMGLLHLVSSTMSKSDYEETCRMMFWQSVDKNAHSEVESLGNTPLNEALIAMDYLIDDFRATHNVQKMNFIALTDGDSNGLPIEYKEDFAARSNKDYVVEINGKMVDLENGYGRGRDNTASLVRNLANKGVKTMNYYICSGLAMVNELYRTVKTKEDVDKKRKEIRSSGVAVLDNSLGYDRRFLMPEYTLQADVNELEINSDMTAAKIAKAFTKSNGSKKKSKIITQKFAEMIA